MKLSPLKFVDVAVNNVPCISLCDSGAQISVISTGLFKFCQSEVVGDIELQGIVGRTVVAPLVNLSMQLRAAPNCCSISAELPVVCAVVDLNAVEYDVILPVDVVKELKNLPSISVSKPVPRVSVVDPVTSDSCKCDVTDIDNDVNDTVVNVLC